MKGIFYSSLFNSLYTKCHSLS